jgi:hypothetical protein
MNMYGVILDLGARRRWVVNFTFRPHQLRESVSKLSSREKYLSSAENRTPVFQPVGRRCSDTVTTAPSNTVLFLRKETPLRIIMNK